MTERRTPYRAPRRRPLPNHYSGATGGAGGGTAAAEHFGKGTGMKAHLLYGKYLLRHKWYVFREACALGVPVLGILHDLSKLRPCEWGPYAAYFYGGPHPESGAEAQAQHTTTKRAVQMAFDEAWLAHQHANKHHWQFYVLHEDDGGTKVLPMPDKYCREMLADWRGAGRAITGKDNTAEWFQENQAHMILHPDTARWLYGQLGRRHSLEVSQTEGSAHA